MYYWCEKDYKLITVQYHRAVLVGYLGQLCWTYEQTGLRNTLSEQNLFVCRGLSVQGAGAASVCAPLRSPLLTLQTWI